MSEPNAHQYAWVEVVGCRSKWVEVRLIAESGCHSGGCGVSSSGGCQTNAFANLLMKQPVMRLALPEVSLAIGDRVRLSVSDRALFNTMLMGYGLPLILLLMGISMGQALYDDVGALLMGLSGLLFGWIIANRVMASIQPSVHEIHRQNTGEVKNVV